MNKKKIVDLIKRYQSGDISLKQEITDELSFYIRNFPKMAYGVRDDDRLSDFYLFFYNKLEIVLRNFDFEKAPFWTYLSKCLMYRWYDFIKENEKIVYDELPSNLVSEVDLLSEPEEVSPVSKIFEDEKNLTNQLVLKLYFFDYFQEKDLITMHEVSNKSFGECLNFLDILMEEILEKRKRANLFEVGVSNLYGRILSYQKNRTKNDEWNQDKQKKLNEIQNKYLKFYRAVLVYPSYKTIGEFWGMDSVAISNIVHRFKHRVKKKYQGKSIEKIIKTFY